MSVLLCTNLTKKYTNDNILKNFSFNFLQKRIYGILGKSDSGKDILLDLLSSQVAPTEGNIWVDGEELIHNNNMISRICYIKRDTVFPPLMTVNRIFKSMKRRYPKWDNYYAFSIAHYFNINLSNTFSSLTIGQRGLLLGICSIASRANITLYNDYVSQADIKDRYDFYTFLYEHYLRYPRTFIIATDFIDEINYMFDKVLFLDKGRLIDFFTSNELKNNFRYLMGKTEVLKSLIQGIRIIGAEERGGILTVCVRKKLTKDEIRKFQKYLITISDVPIHKIFIYLINLRELRQKRNI